MSNAQAEHQEQAREADVTLYTKPDCIQCTMTKKGLDRAGVTYDTIDLTTNPQALEHVKQLGYMAAPVVQSNTDRDVHWAGFNPDQIAKVSTKSGDEGRLDPNEVAFTDLPTRPGPAAETSPAATTTARASATQLRGGGMRR